MNPVKGINPHGLEYRTITYHIIENGVELSNETYTALGLPPPNTLTNGLYCWAGIPKKLRQISTYWTTSYAETRAEYNELQKYVSAKMEDLVPIPGKFNPDGSPVYPDPYWATPQNKEKSYMVVNKTDPHFEGNLATNQLDMYYQYWVNWDTPEFATVLVIDTSGSMGNSTSADFQDVRYATTQALREYSRVVSSIMPDDWSLDSKVILYSGTYLSNVVSSPLIGTFEDANGTVDRIWKSVDPAIKAVPTHSSSEAMLTILYYAIADIYKNMLRKAFSYTDAERSTDKLLDSF